MRSVFHFGLCSIGASLVNAFISSNAAVKHVLHEKRDVVPEKWRQHHRMHPDTVLPVRIGMAQSNLNLGHDMLMEISDPDSPRYSQYYEAEALHDLFAPSKEAQDSVIEWLKSSGIVSHRIALSHNKQWMQIDATVDEMERLLQTEFHVWEHIPTGKPNVACDEYYVPKNVQKHVDYITPGTKLHVLDERNQESRLQRRQDHGGHIPPFSQAGYAGCTKYMYPECVYKLYNITESTSTAKNNSLGIYASFYDIYSQSVANLFFKLFYPRIPQGTSATVLGVDGGNFKPNNTRDEGELFLDTQTAWPIIYPQNIIVWEVNDKYYNWDANIHGWFNTWLDAIDGSYCTFEAFGEKGDDPKIDPVYPDQHPGGYNHSLQCGVYKPTNVMSVSYGAAEAYLPPNYMKRQCLEYMKLGLQGSSIFYCTQDAGAEGAIGGGKGDCYPGSDGKVFAPVFPATCPYVTAVGATVFSKKTWGNESAFVTSNQETPSWSGGGFSNIWEMPSYQRQAVDEYLTKYPPAHKSYATSDNKNVGAGGGVFNRAGRGIPDVVAVGYAAGVFSPEPHSVGVGSGTSYATPLWAAILNRINDARLNAGKKPIGFVNPVLYKNPQVMDDIVKGANTGCPYGKVAFNATPGWDAASGLGTPRYQDLLELFMKLP